MNKIDYNSKNESRKNWKTDFSFDSALRASIINVGAKLRGGGSVNS